MTTNQCNISANLFMHPGETISDLLKDRNLTQKELAQKANVSETLLSDVIQGKEDISEELAEELEHALGIPSSFWLNLQENYNAERKGITYDHRNVGTARWVKMTGMMPPEYIGHYECSNCRWHDPRRWHYKDSELSYKFCPNCGSKMDLSDPSKADRIVS